jgi:hypothetical protein
MDVWKKPLGFLFFYLHTLLSLPPVTMTVWRLDSPPSLHHSSILAV